MLTPASSGLKVKQFLGMLGMLGLFPYCAQAVDTADIMEEQISPQSSSVSHELNADFSYVSGAKAHLGDANFGRVREQADHLRYVISSQLEQETLLRLGVGWQRFSFGVPPGAPLPNTLQSINTVLGADFELTDQWLMRVEIEPGIYSDFQEITFDDVNSPLIIGFSFLVDQNLQWFFGLSGNPRRSIPVLPGVGVRWKFADQWTLMFLFPKPRLEYEVNEDITLYLGGEIKADTYKVARNFGDLVGRSNLNNAVLDYTEGRAGAGVSWKVFPGFTLDIEGGYLVHQEFDFHEVDTRVVNNNGAPYGQIGLRADF